jgi:hypothetical protein
MFTIADAKTITFFKTEAAAITLAVKGEMTEDEGFFIVPAIGRPGCFVIEVRDTDDNMLLGYL